MDSNRRNEIQKWAHTKATVIPLTCPFCTSSDLGISMHLYDNPPGRFYVYCNECCALGPAPKELGKDAAVMRWNTRI